jgi:hypothetical protein
VAPRDGGSLFDEYGRAIFATVIVRKRAIQYSNALMIEPRSCGVLDTPLSLSMTASCEASIALTVHLIEMARSPAAQQPSTSDIGGSNSAAPQFGTSRNRRLAGNLLIRERRAAFPFVVVTIFDSTLR